MRILLDRALTEISPNFFLLGAAKAGTTSLYHYLKQHPQIFLTTVKEPHFFDSDKTYNEGFQVYLNRHFTGAAGYPARGEATPGYFHAYRKVIPRMEKMFCVEQLSFILVFRDPVKRAWSHYLHRRRNAAEPHDFRQALELEEQRVRADTSEWVGYFRDGLYAKQLSAWLDHFPRENFKFILTDDLREDAEQVTRDCFSFLSLNDALELNTDMKQNRASEPKFQWLMEYLNRDSVLKKPAKFLLPYHVRRELKGYLRRKNLRPAAERPQLDSGLDRELREEYREDIIKLSKLINRDLTMWLPS